MLPFGAIASVVHFDRATVLGVEIDAAEVGDGHVLMRNIFACAMPESLVAEWGSMFSHFVGLVELMLCW